MAAARRWTPGVGGGCGHGAVISILGTASACSKRFPPLQRFAPPPQQVQHREPGVVGHSETSVPKAARPPANPAPGSHSTAVNPCVGPVTRTLRCPSHHTRSPALRFVCSLPRHDQHLERRTPCLGLKSSSSDSSRTDRFLPVSSSAHLRLTAAFSGLGGPGRGLHGDHNSSCTEAAVLILFPQGCRADSRRVVPVLTDRRCGAITTPDGLAGDVGSIPIGVLGVTLKDQIEARSRSAHHRHRCSSVDGASSRHRPTPRGPRRERRPTPRPPAAQDPGGPQHQDGLPTASASDGAGPASPARARPSAAGLFMGLHP